MRIRFAAKYVFEDEIVGLYRIGVKASFQKRTAANGALMEAWQRLLSAGLITQALGQAARVMTLTAKGREAAGSVKFEEITMRQMLSREMLLGDLQGSVYENFASGNYDTATRDAFVEVEIAVACRGSYAGNWVTRLIRRRGEPAIL